MSALLILIPIGLILAGLAVGIFIWATRHGQFDDLDSPAILPLLDDDPKPDESVEATTDAAAKHDPAQ